jgi:LysM repeat protein
MRMSGPDFGPYRQWRDAILIGLVLVCFSAGPTRAQDVAEAARQQKAAKQAEPKAPEHVYTEDDLKRNVILTPEDQARVEARRKQFTIPGEQDAEKLPSNDTQGESLGEIAKRYRLEKAAREAELAMKKGFTPFPYEVPAPALAAPAPPVGTLTAPDSNLPALGWTKPLVPNLLPDSSPRLPHAHTRISPFQPRPLSHMSFAPPNRLVVAPAAPVPPSVVRPIEHKVAQAVEKNVQPSPMVAPAAGKRVQVRPGQSWWKLAELYLGNGSRWLELKKLNADVDGPPDLLEAGRMIVVPEIAKATDVAETSSKPQQTITVQKGDSLWSLARKYFGRGSAWVCFARANPQIVDFTHLAVGAHVRVPEGAALDDCNAQRTFLY